MAKIDTARIMQEVNANHEKLEHCNFPHDFIKKDKADNFLPKYVCNKCGGQVDSHGYQWYISGLKHGKI